MIPSEDEAKGLWDKYSLPEKKRIHVQLVADVAMFLSDRIMNHESGMTINNSLLRVGALLHDIDKNIPRLPGEMHPDTGVRILLLEGYDEVANLIRFHSVQFIENPATAPKRWEEKLLFLSDKMVKQEIITVDRRFALWLAEEDLPQEQKEMLRRVYPRVKKLEEEVFTMIGIEPEKVANLLKRP